MAKAKSSGMSRCTKFHTLGTKLHGVWNLPPPAKVDVGKLTSPLHAFPEAPPTSASRNPV